MQWRLAEGKFQSAQEQQLTVLSVAAVHVCGKEYRSIRS